jgi:hypothetical protein
MRREERIEPDAIANQAVRDEHHIAQGVGNDVQHQPVALALVRNVRQGEVRFRKRDAVAIDTLDLEPARRPGDDEAEVAHLRLSGFRPVDLVENPVAQRDPYPADPEPGRHNVLGAGGPGRSDAGSARRAVQVGHG